MSEPRIDNSISDLSEYSLEAILAEYSADRPGDAAKPAPSEPPPPEQAAEASAHMPASEPFPSDTFAARQESIADRSRRIVAELLGETLQKYRETGELPSLDELPQRTNVPAAEAVSASEPPAETPAGSEPHAYEPSENGDTLPPTDDAVKEAPAPHRPRPRVTVGEDGIITIHYDDPDKSSDEPDDTDEGDEGGADDTPEPSDVEPAHDTPPEASPVSDEPDIRAARSSPRPRRAAADARPTAFRERFLAPAVRFFATRLARRQMQATEAANWPEPVDIHDTPELPLKKAAKYYSSVGRLLRIRGRAAFALTLILAWIALGLPMAGMLGASAAMQAGVSVILLLAVTVTALDIFSTGLRQLFELRPGAESLAAMSVLLSVIDGILVLLGYGDSLPFCAVGAAALTAALWGERLNCSALRRTFQTAAAARTPTVLASAGTDENSRSLRRCDRESTEGFVRRAEKQDLCRSAYAVASPILLCAAFVLSVIASLGGGGGHFLHTLSALVSVSASFSAFIGFALPYALTSRRLRASGAAIAGSAGCAEIGKTRRIVITDEDLFPPGTVKIENTHVADDRYLKKSVTYTAALLRASGSGVFPAFNANVMRWGYEIPEVTEFQSHEGGGLTGLVEGERVLVGSAGFMNLMGIRIRQNTVPKNAVCTAISGELVAVFPVEYIPVTSVQEALITLLRGRTQTIFAIRDFNITPLMIRQVFRLPTQSFNFPSFRDRYRLSAARGEDAPIDAVLIRHGMLPLADAAEAGRRLYLTARISTIISLVSASLGILVMFLLCRAGSFDTASAGNVLSFMVVWLLPVIALSLGQNR